MKQSNKQLEVIKNTEVLNKETYDKLIKSKFYDDVKETYLEKFVGAYKNLWECNNLGEYGFPTDKEELIKMQNTLKETDTIFRGDGVFSSHVIYWDVDSQSYLHFHHFLRQFNNTKITYIHGRGEEI